jgi:hypothetical protein
MLWPIIIIHIGQLPICKNAKIKYLKAIIAAQIAHVQLGDIAGHLVAEGQASAMNLILTLKMINLNKFTFRQPRCCQPHCGHNIPGGHVPGQHKIACLRLP